MGLFPPGPCLLLDSFSVIALTARAGGLGSTGTVCVFPQAPL